MPESQIDALSTISGSGPAYVFYLVEQLQEAAVALGFTRAQAATLVQGTFRGASELLATSDVLPADAAPAELRRRVTSPGGTTERAVAELADGGLLELFERTELSKYLTEPELARLDGGGTSSQQNREQGSEQP